MGVGSPRITYAVLLLRASLVWVVDEIDDGRNGRLGILNEKIMVRMRHFHDRSIGKDDVKKADPIKAHCNTCNILHRGRVHPSCKTGRPELTPDFYF